MAAHAVAQRQLATALYWSTAAAVLAAAQRSPQLVSFTSHELRHVASAVQALLSLHVSAGVSQSPPKLVAS
jgi:hypothetical protein